MVAGSYRYSIVVKDGADIVRVYPLHCKRKHTGSLARTADYADPWDCGELLCSLLEQRILVGCDSRHAKCVGVLDGDTQSNCTRNVGGSSFKLEWRRPIGRVSKADRGDHSAAALVGRHLFKQL